MDKLGRNELFYKICDREEREVLALLEKETNVNFQDSNGYSYLHAAVDSKLINVINMLIEKGALINIYDKFERTPLMIAISAYDGDRTIIDLLINNGADVSAKAKSGIDCTQIAMMKGINL